MKDIICTCAKGLAIVWKDAAVKSLCKLPCKVFKLVWVHFIQVSCKHALKTLDLKCVTDHEQFWKTIKPFFSEKSKTSSNNTLKNHEIIISNNEKKLEEFNSFFENTVKSLNIKLSNLILGDITNLSNPVEIAIKKFESNPSVQIIKNKYKYRSSTQF